MISIKDKKYSGYIVEQDGTINVIVNTIETYGDFIHYAESATVIIENEGENGEKRYTVTSPVSATIVDRNIYSMIFSTKPTYFQQLEQSIQNNNDAIDDILVALLEG